MDISIDDIANVNLAKVVIDILKDFDYRNVTQKQLQNMRDVSKGTVGMVDPINRKIYVAKDLSYMDREITQLHEFVHAYLLGVGVRNVDEELVENVACYWRTRLYIDKNAK